MYENHIEPRWFSFENNSGQYKLASGQFDQYSFDRMARGITEKNEK